MILSYIVYCIVFFTSVVTVRRCAYTPRTGYRAYGTVWVSRVLLDSVARRTADATGVMLRVAAPVSCVRAPCVYPILSALRSSGNKALPSSQATKPAQLVALSTVQNTAYTGHNKCTQENSGRAKGRRKPPQHV